MTYVKHRDTLIEYLNMKVDQEDWHGVSDAACDLRELEAEERGRLLAQMEAVAEDMK